MAGPAELTPAMTGKTQMPSAESPTHPQGQAKPMIGEMAQRYPRNLRVYIGYTRPQGKQGLNGHVWGWGKTLCSLACLSLELLNLHVIFWEQEGSGPASLPVITGCLSTHQQLLGTSSLLLRRRAPSSFFQMLTS